MIRYSTYARLLKSRLQSLIETADDDESGAVVPPPVPDRQLFNGVLAKGSLERWNHALLLNPGFWLDNIGVSPESGLLIGQHQRFSWIRASDWTTSAFFLNPGFWLDNISVSPESWLLIGQHRLSWTSLSVSLLNLSSSCIVLAVLETIH